MVNRYIALGGVSLVSMAIGAGVSYLATKKILTAKYEKLIDEELTEARKYYNRLNKREEFSNPTEVLKTYQGGLDIFEDPEIIVEEDDELTDLTEEEVQARSDEKPYIISKYEYESTNRQYHKADLTYYANDDAVIDGGTTPLRNIDGLLGEENLERFGHGSGNKKIVYIRNEELETDFEVDRTYGDFTEEVLGYIEHGDGSRKVLKFHREEE